MCVRACVRACACVRVCACVRARACLCVVFVSDDVLVAFAAAETSPVIFSHR